MKTITKTKSQKQSNTAKRSILPALLGIALAISLGISFFASRNRLATGSISTSAAPAARSAHLGELRSVMASAHLADAASANSGTGGRAASAPQNTAHASENASDLVLVSLRPAMLFAERIWNLRALPEEAQRKEAAKLLKSKKSEDRAIAGILLFFCDGLDEESIAKRLANDRDPAVPLTILEWIKDFGDEESCETFKEIFDERTIDDDTLVALMKQSASGFGGGRAALDLLIPRHDEETISDVLAPVVASGTASYDIREQALFKLLEPETKNHAKELLSTLATGRADDSDSLWTQSLQKWLAFADVKTDDDEEEDLEAEESEEEEGEEEEEVGEGEEVGEEEEEVGEGEEEEEEEEGEGEEEGEEEEGEVPYKVWDTPLKALAFVADSDLGLSVRSMANYLEYGLRRDDPDFEPVVEEGSYAVAKEFFARTLSMRSALLPEEQDALDRLATSIDRLAEYDPALIPDEDESDEEEVDTEILDEEDQLVASQLAEEEDEEDEEEDVEEEDPEEDEGVDVEEDSEGEEEEEEGEGEEEEEEEEGEDSLTSSSTPRKV